MFPLPVRPEISLPEILLYSLLAFTIGLAFTRSFLRFTRRFGLHKKARVTAVDGQSASVFLHLHAHKEGTPVMGGLLMVGAIVLTIALSRVLAYYGFVEHSVLQRGQVYIPLAMLIALGLLGGIDDYLNIRGLGKNRGLDALPKLFFLFLSAGLAAWWFYFRLNYHSIYVPFGNLYGLTGHQLELGTWYIPIFMFVVIGTANAVNVTDGLDGLAAGLLIIAFGAFGIMAYMTGLYVLAGFCGIVVGAVAAFLWHNVPPALFFMGDVGSLALGGTLAVMGFMVDRVLILPLIGLVFVLEMLSVIIQLTSKKFFKRKVFKSAPFHHHFQAMGWPESKITMRLWIIGAFAAFLGILLGIYG